MIRFLSVALLILFCMNLNPANVLSDEGLKVYDVEYNRAINLYGQLRCMVCDGQSLASSDAPLAKDMKKLIIKRIKQGDSDVQIVDDLVNSYGDSILMSPPLKQATLLLWAAPFIMLMFGILLLIKNNFSRQN